MSEKTWERRKGRVKDRVRDSEFVLRLAELTRGLLPVGVPLPPLVSLRLTHLPRRFNFE